MEPCIFNEAWIGRCKKPGAGDPPICEAHAAKKCWCGSQAVRNCDVASSLVCGAPTCETHDCHYVAAGMTGSHGMPHSNVGRKQYEAWQARLESPSKEE